jgi:hypothetical protein
MKRKEKEIKDFTGKDIYSMNVRHNQYSADIVINFAKTNENGEKSYGQAIIDPHMIAEILNQTGLFFIAEKAISNYHVKEFQFFAGG